jgi:hypothetical protein
MFENTVLRRIFAPKREEVARGWRRLHNQELHNLYASPYSAHESGEKCIYLMVGKYEWGMT